MSSLFPSREAVIRQKKMYPKGTRVELISMSDPCEQVKPGDRGTVMFVDDIGTVHVNWDSGSMIGALCGEDRICKIPKE